jgi:glycolate oxidase FAD binding subunit
MDADRGEAFRASVLEALATGRSVEIRGSGSKGFFGGAAKPSADAVPLATTAHRGILSFEPTELVITARGGTPLSEIEAALAEHGQMLAFEPPHFGAGATLGGTLACGFSGPRRAFAGAARDFVLGCRILNGRGEILAFGGQVMKNVAGFDVSRLMVGALGSLGVILEASLKVLPKPDSELTLALEMTEEAAVAAMNRWCGQPWPLSGLAYDGYLVHARLAGAEPAVVAARRAFGGEAVAEGAAFWRDLREQRLPFFRGEGNLWRLSLAPATPPPDLPGARFHDWGGALRWLRTDAPAAAVFRAAGAVGGHATLFRGRSDDGRIFQPLPPVSKALHENLRRAFDPQNIFAGRSPFERGSE